jgi:molybdenum cofactor cytidylyltransferase
MIWAIVLAAGRSRRMGTQKLVLPFGGKALIAHIVDQLLQSKVDRVVCVVAGADAKAITEALGDRKLTAVANPDPAAEMLSSVRCGFAALPPECKAALIALGDQPSIAPALVDRLIGQFRSGKWGIVVPFHDGHRGHPILISTTYRNEILSRHDDTGLRGLLDAHEDDVLKLPCDASVLDDMDYPEDYRRALARISPL